MNKFESLTQPGVAAKIVEQAPLDNDAKVLLTANDSPTGYLAKLVVAELFAEAVKFWAFALPKRNAVEWAMKCVQQVPTLIEKPLQQAAIQATKTWIDKPTDDHRRRAYAAAEAVGLDHPAGCVAMAAFLSEGSLVPADLQAVPPPPEAGPTTAACAIILAAVGQQPENAPQRYQSFVKLGQATTADRGEPTPLPPPPASMATPTSASPPAPQSDGTLPHPAVPPPATKPKRGWY